MELCKDADGNVYKWALDGLSQTEGALQIPNHLTIAVRDSGVIYAGIIFSVIGDICWLTIYAESPRWCQKGILSGIFEIALGLGKIAKCGTGHKNKRINKLLWGLGLHREGMLRYSRPNGQHEIIWSITAKELKKKRWYKCQA